MKRNYLQLAVVILAAIASTACGYKGVQTFAEAADPTPLTEQQAAQWDAVTDNLCGMWASPNIAYSRSCVPQDLATECSVAGWRGEKVSAQLLLWTAVGADGVECTVHTRYSEQVELDFQKHNLQCAAIRKVQLPHAVHDRYLLVDELVWLMGASVKDMGRGLCTVIRLGLSPEDVLSRL